MKEKAKKLEGIIPAIVTPVGEEGEIEYKSLQEQASYLMNAGVNGLFVNGTTGEGGHLSTQEKIDVYRSIRETVGDDLVLCAACIQPSTRAVLEEVRAFEKWEPDFVVGVTPYYYAMRQEDIIDHFRQIAGSSPFPLILYNIPSCTHNRIELDTIFELAVEENIVGVKDSTGDFISFSRGVLADPTGSFPWIQGEDYLDGPALAAGARGVVTGLGNVWIEPYVRMYRAAGKGDWDQVYSCQRDINRLYGVIRASGGRTIAAIKAAASLLGRGKKWMRTRSMTLNDETIAGIKRVLEGLELVS